MEVGRKRRTTSSLAACKWDLGSDVESNDRFAAPKTPYCSCLRTGVATLCLTSLSWYRWHYLPIGYYYPAKPPRHPASPPRRQQILSTAPAPSRPSHREIHQPGSVHRGRDGHLSVAATAPLRPPRALRPTRGWGEVKENGNVRTVRNPTWSRTKRLVPPDVFGARRHSAPGSLLSSRSVAEQQDALRWVVGRGGSLVLRVVGGSETLIEIETEVLPGSSFPCGGIVTKRRGGGGGGQRLPIVSVLPGHLKRQSKGAFGTVVDSRDEKRRGTLCYVRIFSRLRTWRGEHDAALRSENDIVCAANKLWVS